MIEELMLSDQPDYLWQFTGFSIRISALLCGLPNSVRSSCPSHQVFSEKSSNLLKGFIHVRIYVFFFSIPVFQYLFPGFIFKTYSSAHMSQHLGLVFDCIPQFESHFVVIVIANVRTMGFYSIPISKHIVLLHEVRALHGLCLNELE